MSDHHHQHREVHIDMTPSELAGDGLVDYTAGRLGRTHSRSASWTFRSPNTADLPSLASLTSVIREFVPAAFTSEDPMSSSSVYDRSNNTSMEYETVRTFGRTTSSSHVQHSRNPSTSNATQYHTDVESGHHRPPIDNTHPIVEELHPPEPNESVKWFEENMLLILVLVVRFSWMHRLGEMMKTCIGCVVIDNTVFKHSRHLILNQSDRSRLLLLWLYQRNSFLLCLIRYV